MLNVLTVALISYAGSIGQTQLESCATQNCQNVECHGLPPTPGTALAATGKADGGLYTQRYHTALVSGDGEPDGQGSFRCLMTKTRGAQSQSTS